MVAGAFYFIFESHMRRCALFFVVTPPLPSFGGLILHFIYIDAPVVLLIWFSLLSLPLDCRLYIVVFCQSQKL
jgi:hypothetical protein